MANKINILFIMNVMELGGSETLILNIIKNMDRRIWNPFVGWFNKKEPLEEFLNLKIPLFHFPKNKRFDINTILLISNIIKEYNIHVVNAHHYLSLLYCFYGSKIANSSRLVFTEHSEDGINRINGKLKIIGRFMLSRTDASIGVSDRIREALINKYSIANNKTYTIVNGVDLDLYNNKRIIPISREMFGLDKNDIVIGIVANIKYNKNHKFLLMAFKELSIYYNNVKLVIVGKALDSDPECSLADINKFIADNQLEDKVLQLGFRPDVNNILTLMDIFCLVSYKEGLPISLIEAMAAGLPVIGTDSVGIRDIVISGKNGFLVKNDDVEDLKNKLVYLIENINIRELFGTYSRMETINKYSIKDCVKKYETIFKSNVEA